MFANLVLSRYEVMLCYWCLYFDPWLKYLLAEVETELMWAIQLTNITRSRFDSNQQIYGHSRIELQSQKRG